MTLLKYMLITKTCLHNKPLLSALNSFKIINSKINRINNMAHMKGVIPGKGRWQVADGLQHSEELVVVVVGQVCVQCQHRSAWAA